MKLLRQILGPFLALLLTFGSVVEASAPVTVAAAGVVLGVGHAQAATPAQKAVVLNSVPGWVLRASGALPSIDMDFAHNRAWVRGSGPRAPPSLLTTTRASTGYAQWADGHLSLFAANAPRITDLGLLVEQAATNIKVQSQTFETSWAAFHSSITTGATAAPDGTLTGEKLVEDSQNNTHQIHQNSSKAASALVYTATIYAKQAGRTRLLLQLNDNGGNGILEGYDLAGGQLAYGPTNVGTPFTSATASIAALTNGWYRLTLTATSNTVTSVDLIVGLDNGSGTSAQSSSYTGDGASGAFIWGAQVEQTAFATSYIPTTATTATRAADVISLTGTASTAALAAKAAYVQSNLVAGGTLPRLLHYSGGAFMDYASSTTTVISNATNTATATMGSGSYTGLVHNSYGMGTASITAISNNGTKATSANAWAANTGTVYLGSNNGSNALNGYIPRLALGAIFSQFDGVSQ